MKARLLQIAAVLFLASGTLHAQSPDISGNWQGTLQAGQGLRTIVKLSKADTGGWKGQFYSIDQSPDPINLTSVTVDKLNITFAIKQFDLVYTGTFNPAFTTITGTSTQGGHSLPLVLNHVTPDNTWAIPEPPKSMPPDAKPKYDVVTVKPSDPNRPGKLFTIRGRQVLTINTTVADLITFGYSLQTKQIINAPTWMDEKFDVDGVPDIEGQPNEQQMRMLIANALEQRFGLKFHTEQREMTAYVLSVAKGGPKLTVTSASENGPGNFLFGGLGKLHTSNLSMKEFCHGMQEAVMDKPVVDHTGLTGRYDFNLDWTPDQSQFASFGVHIPPPDPNDTNAPPSLYTALQEQLGLKMETTKTNVDVMVIDHIEKPSAN
jgi:uncharacterized protein (TIGR03435 family)